MRVLVFFDLPTETLENKREYRKFHKLLIKNGFLMMQESVYSRMLITPSAGRSVLEIILFTCIHTEKPPNPNTKATHDSNLMKSISVKSDNFETPLVTSKTPVIIGIDNSGDNRNAFRIGDITLERVEAMFVVIRILVNTEKNII